MANYSYLVDDITQAAENDGTEFANYVPKMINRAEERLTRDLDDYGLVSYTSVVIPAGANQVTLPSGTRILKNFNIVANSTRINLLPRTDEYIRDYWPVSASTGTPEYYARRNNTTVLIAPTPVAMIFQKDYNASNLFEQRYMQAIATLQNQARRTRRDDMEAPASRAGADNPVIAGSN
jgi:hypothetical protein